MLPPLAIMSWAIPSKPQKPAWPRLPCCGRTSSITPGHVRFMMPTARLGIVRNFSEAHREEITLHKAAKAAFDEAGLKKLPKAKDLSIEYAELLKKKKEAYPDYRKARDEMQELMKAQKNVEMFFAEEKEYSRKRTNTINEIRRGFFPFFVGRSPRRIFAFENRFL